MSAVCRDEAEHRFGKWVAHKMAILMTEEYQHYFVEEISAKVEDKRRCMSVVSFELVGLDMMCLKEIIRINLNSPWTFALVSCGCHNKLLQTGGLGQLKCVLREPGCRRLKAGPHSLCRLGRSLPCLFYLLWLHSLRILSSLVCGHVASITASIVT